MMRWFKRRGGGSAPETASPVAAVRATRAAELIEAGVAAETRGNAGAAERYFRDAVAADPLSAPAHMNLGIALQSKGEIAAAAAEHAQAVSLDPTLAVAHYNLALARLDLDDPARAELGFREALRLRPEFPEAWVGLAEVMEAAGRDSDALAALGMAIAQRPQYVGALFNSGLLLSKMGRLDDAEALLRGVPEDRADYTNAMTALAATLRAQGRVEEAVDALRAAARRDPDSAKVQGELLFTLGFSDRVGARALFEEHVLAGRRTEAKTRLWRTGFDNVRDPDRCLNIGYLSGDFRRHSVAVFTEFLFERHRRDRVRVHAYSSTLVHDEMTTKFIAAADVWRDFRGQSDATVAAAILDDRIDILVDLAGHTGKLRIGVLAGRAAPVQMTWLGYISSTGLTRIDYRITDPVADPAGVAEALHTERLLRMPHSQWCFRPPADGRSVALARDAALPSFTFGSFNQFAKVSEATIALWIEALKALPGTRLLAVGVPRGSATEGLVRKLTEGRIDRARFDIIERVGLADYYRQYGRVDACLDTTPYSGGTTTCDALWMGVPVVTLTGARSMSRSSASLLTTLGLADLIAHSPEEFVGIASRLAGQGEWSTSARVALRERFTASPLMDEKRFTDDLEALYRQAWGEWCGSAPAV